MSVTLSTIRAAVRSYLDEATAADWSNAELDRNINQRYHRVATMVMTTYEDYYMTTAQFNTVADQQEYDSSDGVPTDIFKLRRIEVNYDVSNSSSSPGRMRPIQSLDEVGRDLGLQNVASGARSYANRNYYTFGYGSNLTIGFIPIPDKTGTNAVKLWYIKTLADLTTDASTIDIPYAERYYHIIVEGATGDGLRFGQQESEEADKYDAKFDKSIILMQEELEDRQADNYKGVMDMSSGNLDFT